MKATCKRRRWGRKEAAEYGSPPPLPRKEWGREVRTRRKRTHPSDKERTKRGSWILLLATAASAAAVEAREGRAAERKRLCKMGKKKEVGGESSGRGSEEGRQHAARTHAPSLLSPKQSSSQRAEGGRKEVAALRRSVAPSSSFPPPSSLPAEIEPDVVGRSVCGGEEKEGRVEREGRRLQRM